MNRQLSPYEVFDLYTRHPDVESAVHAFEAQVVNAQQASGSGSIWADIYHAAVQYSDDLDNLITLGYWDKFTTYFGTLAIPPQGMVVTDPVYGSVIVYPAANGTAYFNLTDNQSLITEVQKPAYVSNPNYLELYETLLEKFEGALPSLPTVELGGFFLLVVAVVVLARRL
jgi:hypothetical protein